MNTGKRLQGFHSIRFRLSLAVAVIVFLAVLLTSAVSGWRSFERDVESQRALLAGSATAYAAALSDPVNARDRAEASKVLRGIAHIPGMVQADIRLADGQLLAQMGSGVILIGRDGEVEAMSVGELWAAQRLRVHVDINKNGEVIGRLGLLKDISDLRAEVIASLQWTALIAAIAIGFAIIGAQLLISRLTRPIRQLAAQMAAFGADQATEIKTVVAGRDETGVLAQAFTGMIESIRERDARIAMQVDMLEDTVEERTRDLRQARDEAQMANAAKSDFLATMSHEIRTPMNGMLVMAEMLSAANLSARHRRYAGIISRSGKSLLTIINDILDLSKIEAGKLELEAAPVSPDALVADVASLFWEKAREKGLELATHIVPEVPAELLGDSTRLNQVITNLVNNALKFTESGGVVVRVSLSGPVRDGQAPMVLEVQDTGIGIPQDRIGKIFEAFSQADQTTTRRFGGTGLGLAVCQRLVLAMGGQITVSSTVGEGSVFRVDWTAPVQRAAPARPDAAGLRVRLSIGDGLTAHWMEKALEERGCRLVDDGADLTVTTARLWQDGVGGTGETVLLSDIGDTGADRLLQSGAARDLLPLPCTRADLGDLLHRAATKSYRGLAALANAASAVERPSFAGLRVLAADDNAVNREVLREALSTLGVEAVFAEDGAEAVELAGRERFDAIFMDGSMPVMDGFEATRRIRAGEMERGSERTPIHALTAQVAGTNVEAWREAGADGHIAKPFTLDRLVAVLSTLGSSAMHPVEDAVAQTQAEPVMVEAGSLLDPETVDMLTGMGARVRDSVWSLFIARAPDGLRALALDLMHTRDMAALSRAAHALKSMALSAGAAGFATDCARLELAGKSGEMALAELADAIEAAQQRLQATLDEMQVAMQAPARAASMG